MLLAFDGGQSGLRVSRAGIDADVDAGRVGAAIQVPGFSWTRAGDPVEQQAANVVAGWRAVDAPDPVDVLALGLSAGGSSQADRIRLCQLLGDRLPVGEIRSTGDDVVTHLGALGGTPGVAVAAGTGTLCIAIDAAGQRRNIDGLGYLFGDEGSGFWLGRAGIRAALASVEQRGAATTLVDALRAYVGPLPVAVKALYARPDLVARVAAFARRVAEAATAGDAVAERICAAAADGLVGDVAAALAFLGAGANAGNIADVAAGGGVLVPGGPVRALFAAELARRCPQARLVEPLGDASAGALMLAGPARFPHHRMAVTWRRGAGIVGTGSPDPPGR